MQIPNELRAALNASPEGIPRSSLTDRAERISSLYRNVSGSSIAICDQADAFAYAITRLPATYGAVRSALTRLQERNPAFTPHSALDLGSSAGAASWAITKTFPQIASIAQVDQDQHPSQAMPPGQHGKPRHHLPPRQA
jgi:ribosomal protein RSM22 (predicted rRNA methylase)